MYSSKMLSAKSSLILGKNKAAFCRESHINELFSNYMRLRVDGYFFAMRNRQNIHSAIVMFTCCGWSRLTDDAYQGSYYWVYKDDISID